MQRRYIYQRSGGPLLNWNRQIPMQSRAGETRGLGSLDEPTLVLPLPRPGSPEPVGCDGGCGCGSRDFVIDITSPSFLIGALVGGWLLGKVFKGG